MRRASTPLTPVLISFFSIGAFLLVMWMAMTDQPTNVNNANPSTTNSLAANANVSDVNDDRILVTNSSVSTNATNTNAVANTNTVSDPTADWKTYTNADFGYSVRYPSDWPIEPQNSSNKSAVTIGNIPVEPSAGPFTIYVKKNDTDLDAFIASFKRGFPDGCGSEGSKTMAGVKWTTLDCKEAFAGQNKKSYFTVHAGGIFHLYYIEGSESINNTFSLILSTFTFTN